MMPNIWLIISGYIRTTKVLYTLMIVSAITAVAAVAGITVTLCW